MKLRTEIREHRGHNTFVMDIKEGDQLKLSVFGSDKDNCLVQAKSLLETRVSAGKDAEAILNFVNDEIEESSKSAQKAK